MNDWVKEVREESRSAVERRLGEDYLPHFVLYMPLLIHMLSYSRAEHSEIVRKVIQLLMLPKHAELLSQVIRSPNRSVRREGARLA
jgi:hypothetical protein